jgi:hypothetical protein
VNILESLVKFDMLYYCYYRSNMTAMLQPFELGRPVNLNGIKLLNCLRLAKEYRFDLHLNSIFYIAWFSVERMRESKKFAYTAQHHSHLNLTC